MARDDRTQRFNGDEYQGGQYQGGQYRGDQYRDYDEGPRFDRQTTLRRVNGLIRLVTGLFAAVLAVHIVLVVAGANFGNPFASFIADWAGAITLGLGDLFTPNSENLAIALNQGIAAALWLVIGLLLTTFLSRVVLPGPGRP